MFKKWFKPKWEHEHPNVRTQAVKMLDNEKLQERAILENLAQLDPNESVRIAAATKLSDPALLVELYQNANLLSEKDALITCFTELVSTRTKDESVALFALEHINNAAFLESMIRQSPLANIRQKAAHLITNEEQLLDLENTLKNKDKGTYRIIKDKLKQIKSKLKQLSVDQAELEATVTTLEHLSQQDPSPLLPHQLKQLTSKWNKIDQDKSNWQERYNQALKNCQTRLTKHQEHIQTMAAAKQEQLAAAQTFEHICETIEQGTQLISSERNSQLVDLAGLKQIITEQKNAWHQAQIHAQADPQTQARYQKNLQQAEHYIHCIELLQSQHQKLEQWIEQSHLLQAINVEKIVQLKKSFSYFFKQLKWPIHFLKPNIMVKAENSVLQLKQLHQQAEQALLDFKNKVAKNLKDLKEEVKNGHLKEVNKKLKHIQSDLQQIPIKESQTLQNELRKITQSVNELRNWQGYAIIPKKQALTEQMQNLIKTDIPAPDKAERIKLLQNQWRTLGNSQCTEEKTLWQAFKEAADQAYEPCKAYFTQQNTLKQENLNKRVQLCDQLEHYAQHHNWTHADWPLVFETLKTARTQWRQYTPIEHHQASKQVQKRFDQIIQTIQSHTDAYKQNLKKQKRALIEQMTTLLDDEDLSHAITQSKNLQEQWRKIGRLKYNEEQALYQEFRKLCDVLFARRQQSHKERQLELENNKQAVLSLQAELESLQKLSNEQLLASKKQAQALYEQFEKIAPLPKTEARQIREAFQQSYQNYQAQLNTHKQAVLEKQYEHLWQACELLETMELAILEQTLSDTALQDIKHQWSDIGPVPETAETDINARFDSAINAYTHSTAEAFKQAELDRYPLLHTLTLHMEILAGLESPQEDQDQRMALQVDRLSQKMSLGHTSGQRNLSNLELRQSLEATWCCTGPININTIKNLKDRFLKAKEHIQS